MIRKMAVAMMLAAALVSTGCAKKPKLTEAEKAAAAIVLTEKQKSAAENAGLTEDEARLLEAKPLFEMKPAEVDKFLAYTQITHPDLRQRVVHIGRKNLGQPYELYLLGEFPYEMHDPQPTYCLDKSDCVVFVEHAYAMALSKSWGEFYTTLQKIRYRDGQIGVATRNHYTEADWNPSNTWLVEDVSAQVAGSGVKQYNQKVDRASFLKRRYKLETDIPVERIKVEYVPLAALEAALPKLQDGDFVNVIVGRDGGLYATHVGMIAVAPDGTRNLLHSTPPKVREEPITAYVERAQKRNKESEAKNEKKPILQGFKFLRLKENPVVPAGEIGG